jgi:hypothetical protein
VHRPSRPTAPWWLPFVVALGVIALGFGVELALYRPPEARTAALRCGVMGEEAPPPPPRISAAALWRERVDDGQLASLLALGVIAGLVAYGYTRTRPDDDDALGPIEAWRRYPATRLPIVAGAAVGLAGVLPAPDLALLVLSLGAAGVGVVWLRRLDTSAIAATRSYAWSIVLGLALLQSIRLAGFMVDATRDGLSALPFDEMYPTHSCFSAYYEAARRVHEVANIYDHGLYLGRMGPLFVDDYLYPPPFLLLPRALLLVSSDFFTLRSLWFIVELALLIAAMARLARYVGGRSGATAALAIGLVLVAPPTQLALQIGNFHPAALALAILAMLAFERERPAVGGAILAFVTLSKIFPGVLILYLLVRRRWSAVAWTAAMMLVWTGTALAVLGRAPFDAFVREQLPALSSGAAFPMLWRSARAVAQNQSVYGLPLKLAVLGVPGLGRDAASLAATVYALVLLGVVVGVARSARVSPLGEAQRWMALLYLASLRSPFAPGAYVQLAPLWLLTLVMARSPTARPPAALLWLAAGALCIVPPYAFGLSPREMIAIDALPQLASIALAIYALRSTRTP